MVKEKWISTHIKDIATIYGRIGFRGYTKQDIVKPGFGAISLSPSNIKDGKVTYAPATYISWEKYEESPEIKLSDGDVVLVKTGSTFGKTAYIDRLPWPTTLNPQIVVFKKLKIHAKLFAYFMASKNIQEQISSVIVGGAIPTLSQEQVYAFDIVYPPDAKEQAAIAEALSDIDSLISSLQQLIEKKKAIKKGAMQELLTGKKRLPGFSEEWSKQQLGDICNIVNGGTPSTSIAEFWNGKILWCTPTDITSCSTKYIYTTESKITESGLKASSATLLPKGALLLCSRATIGEVRIAGNTICTNQGFKSLVVHQNISNEWLYYMVHVLKSNMLEKAIGSTFLEISKKDLAELDIIVPEFTEQKAIAQVLSVMDSEIEQLEKKLSKYQQIKQGMMQELLTGRIRLVDADGKEQPKTQILQERQPEHNQHFDDAVMIAGIVNAFYSEKYPLGRKKVQKLLYLVRRKEQADISAFHKKAAGPYADEVRYKGGEPIAQKNKYIQVRRSEKGSCFEKDVQMQQALTYLQDWGKLGDVDWLVSQFQYTSVNELELLATVDMAICDLRREGKETSVASIKDLIRSNKEWRDKLKKTYFRDSDIQRAIIKCQDLFES